MPKAESKYILIPFFIKSCYKAKVVFTTVILQRPHFSKLFFFLLKIELFLTDLPVFAYSTKNFNKWILFQKLKKVQLEKTNRQKSQQKSFLFLKK